jgi:RNA polymerase sigma-70 factor, ECF subfamily
MLGSLQDAEDLVQETLLRAWQRIETYEGRASFRAWLYKIATNLCLDALARRPRRSLPPGKFPASNPDAPPAPPLGEPIWLEPIPDEWLAAEETSPEARFAAQESITLAFLAAVQILPPRQRAVLLLCDVLDWRAREVAGLLGLTVSAVNSALHRARVTLAKHYRSPATPDLDAAHSDEMTRGLLERYVRAWENADVEGLVTLLKEDATFTMPPIPSWYRGRAAIGAAASAIAFGAAGRRWKLVVTRANGQPAFGAYLLEAANNLYKPFGIQVLSLTPDTAEIADITTFISPALFARFRLPTELKA